jgi:hypothetical protein
MFRDWQIIIVWLIIGGALFYVGRRGWGRVSSFRAGGKAQAASCASGCGGCGVERGAAVSTRAQNALVQITNPGSASPPRLGQP